MDYFEHNPAPAQLSQLSSSAKSFIAQHSSASRRVALVTSGGTTVPLENQTVRFIDNFSAGTRGACSAEYFLENGYAVIFLHRQFSLLPYSRHYSHSTNCFLDYLTGTEDGPVVVQNEYQQQMAGVLRRYRKAKKENTLLLLPFTTVNEYLWYLRELAVQMQPLGANALFYLAAAVSDFFVPAKRMVEHKIQSSEDFYKPNGSGDLGAEQDKAPAAHMDGGSLIIDLDPVPKFLKLLVDEWSPHAMIVSFKLETDPALLGIKAQTALDKYAHHLVIGNLLNTRKWEVLFVSKQDGEKWLRVPKSQRIGSGGKSGVGEVEIESWIVPEVERLHGIKIEKDGPRNDKADGPRLRRFSTH